MMIWNKRTVKFEILLPCWQQQQDLSIHLKAQQTQQEASQVCPIKRCSAVQEDVG